MRGWVRVRLAKFQGADVCVCMSLYDGVLYSLVFWGLNRRWSCACSSAQAIKRALQGAGQKV